MRGGRRFDNGECDKWYLPPGFKRCVCFGSDFKWPDQLVFAIASAKQPRIVAGEDRYLVCYAPCPRFAHDVKLVLRQVVQ